MQWIRLPSSRNLPQLFVGRFEERSSRDSPTLSCTVLRTTLFLCWPSHTKNSAPNTGSIETSNARDIPLQQTRSRDPQRARPLIPTPKTKIRANARGNPMFQHGASSLPNLSTTSCHSVQPLERPLRRPTDHSNARTTVHTSSQHPSAGTQPQSTRRPPRADKFEIRNPKFEIQLHSVTRASGKNSFRNSLSSLSRPSFASPSKRSSAATTIRSSYA